MKLHTITLEKIDQTADLAARVLLITTVLNLNGFFRMAFNAERSVSVVMLLTSLFLLSKCRKYLQSKLVTLLSLTIFVYLVVGTVFYNYSNGTQPLIRYWIGYLSSLLIILAIASYTISAGYAHRLDSLLRFIRGCLVVVVVSVILSPILYEKVYITLPPSDPNRFGGLFGNPNEAGIMSCLALVGFYTIPFRSKIIQASVLVVAFAAIVLTFSKTAIVLAIFLTAWAIARSVKKYPLLLYIVIPLALSVSVYNIDLAQLFSSLANKNILDLNDNQRVRISAIGEILTGTINADTSTGRTELWKLGIERAIDVLPFSTGLGSYHSFVGGEINQSGVWVGVHNTFLMFWGEGGVFAAMLLLFTMAYFLLTVSQLAARDFEVSCLLILIADMSATHNALLLRYNNIFFGLVLGMTIYAMRSRNKVRIARSTKRIIP